jgi:hypothetical protein
LAPTILPALTSFVVNIYLCSNFISFLKPLVLPQLAHLVIDGRTKIPDPWNSSYIPTIISFGRLEKPSLGIPEPDIDVDVLLHGLPPRLVEFSPPRGDILSTMTLDLISRGELLPKLETICCKVAKHRLDAHLDIVENRKTCEHNITAELYWEYPEEAFRQEGGES